MNKEKADIFIIVFAFSVGILISVVDNPLTAAFVLIGIMMVWELINRLPMKKKEPQQMHG